MADWLELWFNFITNGLLIYLTWYLGKKGVTFYQQWKDDKTIRDDMIKLINNCITDFYGVLFEWNKFVDHVLDKVESGGEFVDIDLNYEYEVDNKIIKYDVSFQLFTSRFMNNFIMEEKVADQINDLSKAMNEYTGLLEERKDIERWPEDNVESSEMTKDILQKLIRLPILVINTPIKRV